MKYRLNSSPAVYAPGILAWAQNGYAFPRDRAVMLNVMMSAWPGVPEWVMKDLLAKKIPYRVVDETVEFQA